MRLDSHRRRPLLNFEEENRARITHVCRNGDIMTCSSLNKGFECARYHNNKWKTIKKFEGKKLKLASIQFQNIQKIVSLTSLTGPVISFFQEHQEY